MKSIHVKFSDITNSKNDVFDTNAIIDNNMIKYVDNTKTKVSLNYKDDILIRENSDYIFNIDFNKNIIDITLKKFNKMFSKDIKTLLIKKDNKSYIVRYKLVDEEVINEYEILY